MDMCRLCLTTEQDIHPFDETFVINYNLLTNLNVSLLDGMPQSSCKSCLLKVKNFIAFRKKSIESEATLRDIFSSHLKMENTDIELQCESGLESENLKSFIKDEIKLEKDDNDSVLDNIEAVFEEYVEDIKNLVKDEDVTPIKTRKRKNIKKDAQLRKKQAHTRLRASKNISDGDQWLCGICPKTFEEQTELQMHLDNHKEDRQCHLCKEKVNSLSQLLAHRLNHVPSKQFHCHICAKFYKSCLYLEHHYRNIHIDGDDPKLECKMCQKKFISPKRLNSHILHVHSDIKMFCSVCSKGFTNKQGLKSHVRQHSQIKSYVCDLCGFSCNYSGGLKDHKVRRHSSKKLYCKNCGRVFPSQLDYDRHKCKPKMKVCPICGRQITGNSRLSSHMAQHSDEYRYECDRCPAKYKSKTNLIIHINKHDGNRTKQCEYCPAKFYSANVLIKHRRTHTGEKPYVCRICNKGFTGNHNLKVHMKVHGENLIVKKNMEKDVEMFTKTS